MSLLDGRPPLQAVNGRGIGARQLAQGGEEPPRILSRDLASRSVWRAFRVHPRQRRTNAADGGDESLNRKACGGLDLGARRLAQGIGEGHAKTSSNRTGERQRQVSPGDCRAHRRDNTLVQNSGAVDVDDHGPGCSGQHLREHILDNDPGVRKRDHRVFSCSLGRGEYRADLIRRRCYPLLQQQPLQIHSAPSFCFSSGQSRQILPGVDRVHRAGTGIVPTCYLQPSAMVPDRPIVQVNALHTPLSTLVPQSATGCVENGPRGNVVQKPEELSHLALGCTDTPPEQS